MEMETAPLSEAERLYLRSRIPLLMVLFSFGLLGMLACLYFINRDWPTKSYGMIALLILDIAACNLLWRPLRRQWKDLRAGKKRVLTTTVDRKYTREKGGTQYFLKVADKEYRVTPEAYNMYAEGQSITVYFTFHGRAWMGFAPV